MDSGESSRKACDLCYRRRIKCDAKKPRCSHCVIYESECTRKMAARKAAVRKKAAGMSREAALEERVKTLEAQLAAVMDKVDDLQSPLHGEVATPEIEFWSNSTNEVGNGLQISADELQNDQMPLGSLHDVLPPIEWYLRTSNSYLPLFNSSVLLNTVRDWYYKPHTRERANWAMINVVLALAHHTGYEGPRGGSHATYISNAQSVLTEAISHETKLVHIQVLIGLSMLFKTAADPTPATVLVATAMRLAQKLRLNRRSPHYLDHRERQQRERVFWLAYIMDRAMVAHTKLAPIQSDDDIEIDMPSLEPPADMQGWVVAGDGPTKMNILRAYVQMAKIQEEVHTCVYSVSGQNSSPSQRADNIFRVHRALEEWKAQIPVEFHPTTLARSGNLELCRQFCMVYCVAISARAMISYCSAQDKFHYSKWVGRLHDDVKKATTGQEVLRLADQHDWHILIAEARDFLALFRTVRTRDAIFTMTTLCAYMTSLICLSANSLFNALDGIWSIDEPLIEATISPLEHIVKETGCLPGTYDALKELRSHTKTVMEKQKLRQPTFGAEDFWSTAYEPPDTEVLRYLFPVNEDEAQWNMYA
ncbi:hypothetical protein GGR57DRAFT_466103 [Xylariaceae sp. FL1272]|nr:hypothetical protein GGR57DRAFT_466103 [Xylariaceae sp. FL1272]